MTPPILYAYGDDWPAVGAPDCVHPDWRRSTGLLGNGTEWVTVCRAKDELVRVAVGHRGNSRAESRFNCWLEPVAILPSGVPAVCPLLPVRLRPWSDLSVWQVLGSDRHELGELFAEYLVGQTDPEAARYAFEFLSNRLPDDWEDRDMLYWELWDELVGRLPSCPLRAADGVKRRRL